MSGKTNIIYVNGEYLVQLGYYNREGDKNTIIRFHCYARRGAEALIEIKNGRLLEIPRNQYFTEKELDQRQFRPSNQNATQGDELCNLIYVDASTLRAALKPYLSNADNTQLPAPLSESPA